MSETQYIVLTVEIFPQDMVILSIDNIVECGIIQALSRFATAPVTIYEKEDLDYVSCIKERWQHHGV